MAETIIRSPFRKAPPREGRPLAMVTVPGTSKEEVKSLSFPQRQVSSSTVEVYTLPAPKLDHRPHQLKLLENLFHPPREDLKVGGKIKFHLKNWLHLTHDPYILDLVKGFRIPLTEPVQPSQNSFPPPKSRDALEVLDKEVASMLEKKAIRVVSSGRNDRVFSHLFVAPKKDGGFRPIVNLKKVNAAIPYNHFQMEGLKNVQDLIEKGDYLVKIDLSDAFFSIPLHKESRRLVAFQWRGIAYEFRVLCFGMSCVPLVFTKLLKVPISFLRKMAVRVVIYLDDLILFGRSLQEAEETRDLAMTLLSRLGFTINMKKSILAPCQSLVYLGITVNSVELTFSLPEEKIDDLLSWCDRLISRPFRIRDLSKLIGKLISTMPAVSTALLQVRFLQRCLIGALRGQEGDYEATAFLDENARLELEWWSVNLKLRKGRPLSILPPDLVIQSDAAGNGGWGAHFAGFRTGGQWKLEEKDLHINVKEIIAADLAIRTYVKWKQPQPKSLLLQVDNTVALAYIANQGGTKSLDLLKYAKKIWEFLSERNIQISLEWLPSLLNKEADEESRNVSDSSEWLLDPIVFHQLCLSLKVAPTIDLFASRISHLLPRYMTWKADPEAIAVNALLQDWTDEQAYAFPPFPLIGKVLQKLKKHEIVLVLVCPIWPSQPWWSKILEMAIKAPLKLPLRKDLLSNPRVEIHPLLAQGPSHLPLAAWLLSGDVSKQTTFRKSLSSSSQTAGEQALVATTKASGLNSVAGAVRGVQIPFTVL